jgi:hypothetical protein
VKREGRRQLTIRAPSGVNVCECSKPVEFRLEHKLRVIERLRDTQQAHRRIAGTIGKNLLSVAELHHEAHRETDCACRLESVGVAKYWRRAAVRLSGETRPSRPTPMVKRATSNAATLMGRFYPSSQRTNDRHTADCSSLRGFWNADSTSRFTRSITSNRRFGTPCQRSPLPKLAVR